VLIVVLLIAGLPAILPTGFVKFGPIKPSSIETSNLLVLAVNKGSAAEKADIKVGSEILSINGQNLATTEQLQTTTREQAGKQVEIVVRKNGQDKTVQANLGSDEKTGFLGLAAQPMEVARYHPLAALVAGVVVLFQMVVATIAAFGEFIVGLFTRAQVSENVAGPVGIVGLFGGVIQFGWRYALAFVASISLSLAVINALPIPALDGGRLFVMTLSRLGVKISPQREALVHWAGFILLMLLVIIVTISDISRL
jgi:regulator of sigma E protease